MRPKSEGGLLYQSGQVEVISSLDTDGVSIPYDIRFGVWVVFEGDTSYIRNCFEEYGVHTDDSGRYASIYKRWHHIGLEVGVSVASVGVRQEPTGVPTSFGADVMAAAKKDLKAGDTLDGEGGYTVVGRLAPAEASLRIGALPLGLAHELIVKNDVRAGQPVTWDDVTYDSNAPAVKVRQEMESQYR